MANGTAGPIEEAARMATEPDSGMLGAAREVYIVTSRFGPEGIFSTPDRAREKVTTLSQYAAYRNADSGLMVRPYVLDSE